MQVDLRQPHISGNDHEMLVGLKNYLFQLRDQLEWAFQNIEATSSGGGGGTTTTVITQTSESTETKPPSAEDAEITFNAIKALIIKSSDIIDAYYDEINTRLEGVYVAESEFGDFASRTTQSIHETATEVSRSFDSITALTVETNQRITEAEERTRSSLDNQRLEVTQKIEGVTQDLIDTAHTLQTNIDMANTQIDANSQETATIRGDLSSVTQNVSELSSRLSESEKRLASEINDISGENGSINSLLDYVDKAMARAEGSIAEINTNLSKFGVTYSEVNTDTESYALIIKSNGYVKTGKIYDEKNGVPVYGIEVGQTVEVNGRTEYRGFARFTSEEIVFFDENSLRAAWLSKRRLHATEVEATERQKIGGFVDVVDPITKDVTTIWEED